MNFKQIQNKIGVHRIADATSSELRQIVKSYGLDPSGKSVKQLESMIGMAQWAKEHPDEEFPEQFDPMLIHDKTTAGKEWIDEVLNSSEWIIQTKINGMRSILQLYPTGKIRMTSRSRSVKDFTFTPHQDNVLGFQDLVNPFKGKTVFDGELFSKKTRIDTGATITESPLQAVVALVHMNAKDSLELQEKEGNPLAFKAFDILWFDGENVQELPYEKRDELLRVAVSMLMAANPELQMEIPETLYDFKSAYDIFKIWVEKGEEGLVVKRRTGKYQQGARSRDQFKLKGFVTVDGYITGAVPSKSKAHEKLIGGFKVSALVDGEEREIAAISNIKMDVRKEATVLDEEGKPTLNPDYLMRVVEMIGQEWGKNMRLGSARINEWRPDKDPEDCKMTLDDIKPKDWSKTDK